MYHNQKEFNDLLEEIIIEVERIYTEVDITDFIHTDNVYTYNTLTTTLLQLQRIKGF